MSARQRCRFRIAYIASKAPSTAFSECLAVPCRPAVSVSPRNRWQAVPPCGCESFPESCASPCSCPPHAGPCAWPRPCPGAGSLPCFPLTAGQTPGCRTGSPGQTPAGTGGRYAAVRGMKTKNLPQARNYGHKRARPRARRALMTARPPFVLILARNPCVRARFRLLG